MTTEEKMSNQDKRQPRSGFPFGCPEGIGEMMRTWCQTGFKFCDCCPMAKMTKDEESK